MSNLVAVIHTKFEGEPSTVAFVKVPEDAETLTDKLEYAYKWTNNIHGSWSLKIGNDANPNVTVVGDISDGMGLRSTSMGDQMLVGNKKYVVAMMGFETLEGEKI